GGIAGENATLLSSRYALLERLIFGQAFPIGVGEFVFSFDLRLADHVFDESAAVINEPNPDIAREVDLDAAQDNAAVGRIEIARVRHATPRRFTQLRRAVRCLRGFTGGGYYAACEFFCGEALAC